MFTRRVLAQASASAVIALTGLRSANARASAEPPGDGNTPAARLDTAIRFSFEILDLVTNHQYEGQRNSFFVTYEYAGLLRSAPLNEGHPPVAADTFPYFQTVRDDIVDYVHDYPSPSDFYEVFASNIAHRLMQRYAQFRWIELTIRVPAFAGVALDRAVTVRVARGEVRAR